MENRSFDHMVGWMKKSINPAINFVTGDECNPTSTKNPNPQSICFTDDAEFVDPDPGHSFEAVEQQIFGSTTFPSMSGFVEQALSMSPNLSETVMKGFRPEAVPVYASLPLLMARPVMLRNNWLKATLKKNFESLHENGKDFGIYFQNIPTTLFYRNLRKLKHVFKFHQFDLKFKKDARDGKLPSLTVIEPRYFDLNDCPQTMTIRPTMSPTARSSCADYYGLSWIKKGTVISGAKEPTPNSEFEHSSIPATIKKMFVDKSETLPDVVPLRTTEAKEDASLSEFQSEIVQLATVLNGDHFLSSFPNEMSKKMTVKEAHEYTRGAVSRFICASKEAIKLGADKSAIVDMRSSLTTRSSNL
ncbi:Non-specific phospholipase C6 [Hibiscus syriacus]|uniref:Non-specific phospholipase C6 n=1 Tax=Hibiscus syriacus TaxID=106335 RepID=A0A6A2ZB04_HIBSY|nr:Non-specific phospholipase C6 [Hibiscus syriacus]